MADVSDVWNNFEDSTLQATIADEGMGMAMVLRVTLKAFR